MTTSVFCVIAKTEMMSPPETAASVSPSW